MMAMTLATVLSSTYLSSSFVMPYSDPLAAESDNPKLSNISSLISFLISSMYSGFMFLTIT